MTKWTSHRSGDGSMKREPKHTLTDLRQRQALPLSAKLAMTKLRIREWVEEFGVDGVYVSFSGGKDSAVLLHIVRGMYPDVPAVFSDTGLEFPEIRDFVKTFDNVIWVKPKMNFKTIIQTYGYPFLSKELSAVIGGAQRALAILEAEGIDIHDTKAVTEECQKRFKKKRGEWRRLAQALCKVTKENEIKYDITKEELGIYSVIPHKYQPILYAPFKITDKCCRIMKKSPMYDFHNETGRNPMTAQMADESRLRTQQWLSNGCNMFDAQHPISNPMSFWTEQDVLKYIKINNLPICSVYGNIIPDYGSSGEMDGQMDFSDIGCMEDKRKYKTTGCDRTGCMFCGYGCHIERNPNRFERMKETHPKQYDFIMKPTEKGGLGFKEVIDWLNENCGLGIKY